MPDKLAGSDNSAKRFRRKLEDFACENCGRDVRGTGYTDHCPECLYSKHVDINPGDRASECMGMMKPVSADHAGGDFIIYYVCESCGFRHRIRAAAEDNKDLLVELANAIVRHR